VLSSLRHKPRIRLGYVLEQQGASERGGRWTSRGFGTLSSDGYRGSLRVLDRAVGSSGVEVHVTVRDERVASFPDAEAEIRQGMEEALDRLSSLVGS